jgi:hypothetical protein
VHIVNSKDWKPQKKRWIWQREAQPAVCQFLVSFAQVGAELPIDSDDANEENKSDNGRTLLYVFEKG